MRLWAQCRVPLGIAELCLSALQEQRSRVREYAQAKAEREGKQADDGHATYSKAELDAMWAEVNTLKAERETLKGIVDSLKQPLEEHTAAADELWKKKSEKRKELVSHFLHLYTTRAAAGALQSCHPTGPILSES